jgi:hypothetical protein
VQNFFLKKRDPASAKLQLAMIFKILTDTQTRFTIKIESQSGTLPSQTKLVQMSVPSHKIDPISIACFPKTVTQHFTSNPFPRRSRTNHH